MLLEDLARRIAMHRATDAVLFEHLGGWVASTRDAALKPLLAAWAGHHSDHLDLWADRFPAVAGLDLDVDTRTARARLASTEQQLTGAASDRERLVAALVVLDRHEAACSTDRAGVDQLLDAPTARVLDLVLADLRADAVTARAALARL
jgi:hypothetical protein